MLFRARSLAALLLLLIAFAAPPAFAQVDFDDAFPHLPDFDRPVGLQRAPGSERLFVIEQPGLIVSFEDEPGVSAVDTLLDLRDVAVLYDGVLPAGDHTFPLTDDLAPGTYYVRLTGLGSNVSVPVMRLR